MLMIKHIYGLCFILKLCFLLLPFASKIVSDALKSDDTK